MAIDGSHIPKPMKIENHNTKNVTKLQNNANLVATSAGNILVNSPPEILKILLVNGLEIPEIVLLPPDVPAGQQLGSSGFVHQGINYASVEFLLYANYFVNGGRRTKIITATRHQATRIQHILQETISGPKDIEEYYPHPWVMRECRSLAKNRLKDEPLVLSDLVYITSIDNGGGVLSHQTQIIHQDSQYIFTENGHTLATISTKIDQAAFPLTMAPPQPLLRQDITLQFLGGSNGYDPDGITTCFLAYFASTGRENATLFDAAAYLKLRLGNIGISPNQISEVVISHLHEDHIAGLSELILGSGRIRVITSHMIYRSLLRVLSAILAVPSNEVASLFDFYPLEPKQPLILDGRYFEAIYAIHTIPTLAVRVNGLCYSGDIRYDEIWFDQLVADGILSKHRRDELIQFGEGARILVQDAGGGSVHTTPTPEVLNALAAKSRLVILTHTQKNHFQHHDPLANWDNVEFAQNGHIASFGEDDFQEPNIDKFETISTCPLYARLSISNRLILAENTEIQSYETGQTILSQGEPSNGQAFIVHKGLVETSVYQRQTQVWGRGYSIGERGAISKEPRLLTVTAYANTQLVVLDETTFQFVSRKLGLEKVFRRVEWLWSHPLFQHLAWSSLLDLALDFQPMTLPVGRLLFEYGVFGHECYLLKSGEISLFDKDLNPIGTFNASGEFFGGRSILFGTPRNSYACVSQESEIWALPAAALQRLQMLYPSIILYLRSVEMKRLGTPPFISTLEKDKALGLSD